MLQTGLRRFGTYTERYLASEGLSKESLGGFGRVTKNYPMRRVRDRPVNSQSDNIPFYNHLKWRTRFRVFLSTKKKRLFMIFMFVVSFNYTGNIAAMSMATVERTFKKKKIEWLRKWYPEIVAP